MQAEMIMDKMMFDNALCNKTAPLKKFTRQE